MRAKLDFSSELFGSLIPFSYLCSRIYKTFMLDRLSTIEKLKSSQRFLSDHYGVTSMLLFGSLAKNEQKESSDVDVCVEMQPNLFRQAGVKAHLQELLGCDVDVVRMRKDMNSVFKRQIQKYGIRVF